MYAVALVLGETRYRRERESQCLGSQRERSQDRLTAALAKSDVFLAVLRGPLNRHPESQSFGARNPAHAKGRELRRLCLPVRGRLALCMEMGWNHGDVVGDIGKSQEWVRDQSEA